MLVNQHFIQLKIDFRCGFLCITFLWDYNCQSQICSKCHDLASAKLATIVPQKSHAPKSTSTINFQLTEMLIDQYLQPGRNHSAQYMFSLQCQIQLETCIFQSTKKLYSHFNIHPFEQLLSFFYMIIWVYYVLKVLKHEIIHCQMF